MKQQTRAFSLLEIMVAVAVLSVGLIPVSRSLLGSLHVSRVYAERWDVQPWIEEKLWDIEEELKRNRSITMGETTGYFRVDGRKYEWAVDVILVDSKQDVYLVDVNIVAPSKRKISVSKYMLAPVEEKLEIQQPAKEQAQGA